jgi:hypothetical protein
MQFQQQASTKQVVPSFSPIDSNSIIEHGKSPTAIILAIAILLAMLFNSLAGLVRVILLLLRHYKTKE